MNERQADAPRADEPYLDERRAPDRPTELGAGTWWAVLKRTIRGFREDNLRDWAAALTCYAVRRGIHAGV